MKGRRWISLMIAAILLMSLVPAGTLAATGDSGECRGGGAHEWRSSYDPAPTCTTGGTLYKQCTKCGATTSEKVGPLGHSWGAWKTTREATCTESGTKVRTCSRCGEQETGTIPATGHSFGKWKVDQEATCTQSGKRHRTCSKCGKKETSKIKALGHEWDEGKMTKEPTPDEPGERTFTCKRDPSHTYKIEVPYGATEWKLPEPNPDGEPDPEPDPVPDPDADPAWAPAPMPDPEPAPDPATIALTLMVKQTSPVKAVYELNDPIWWEATLVNDSSESVTSPSITVVWGEGDVAVYTLTDSITLAPGESFTRTGDDYIIQEDVDNGHVTFTFKGQAVLESSGNPVNSPNVVMCWETAHTEPEPEDGTYSLKLDVSPVSPKEKYTVDAYGDTEEIPYQVQVTNTGSLPILFSDLDVYIKGVPGTHTEPVQYLLPGEPYSFKLYGIRLNESQVTPGTGSEKILGEVNVAFVAVGNEPNYGNAVSGSNTVSMNHKLAEPGGWDPPFYSFEVKKEETSSPMYNPNGYVLNETITYNIIVTNTGELTVGEVKVHDNLYDDGGSDVIAVLTDMAPNETRVVPFSYTVTQQNVDDTFVSNQAAVTWFNSFTDTDMSAVSNIVKSPTAAGLMPGGLVVEKTVTSKPDNDSYYTPGEHIIFHIRVTNTMDMDIDNVLIYDWFFNSVFLGTMTPNDVREWDVDHEATDPDADLGYVSNVAYGGGFIREKWIYGTSNEVTVPVHRDPPANPVLKLKKEEISKPANGKYYVLGETITYLMTAENAGNVVMYDVALYDSLDTETMGDFAHFGIVKPGETVTANYSHVVTQDDVDTGYVENWVRADFWISGESSSTYSVYAGPVYSPTGEKTAYRQRKPFTPEKSGSDSCRLILRGTGNYTILQEQHYCPTHEKCKEQVEALLAEATTDAGMQNAWQQAEAIWRSALAEEYDEILAAANGQVRLAAAQEKETFYRYLNALEAMLRATAPAQADKVLCGVMMNQCTELCYLRNNAGAMRPDSVVSGRYTAIENDMPAPKCSVTTNPARGGDLGITRMLCEGHGSIQAAASFLMSGMTGRTGLEDAFRRVRRLWQTSLDKAATEKFLEIEGEARDTVTAFRVQFDRLLTAQEKLLETLYPSNPEITAEIISSMMRDQVIMICEIW